ncbi:unnamed protein product (macronuclear) [Paramecium tetraurelia]|uniref:B box-type domain-containing protein n=1 Tax=Paramecium tetraurelia TaxID=5888 RepID=A0CJ12_PARTE|nr:uncharacterized protein GSPATT00007914001 [Paramecium tetraurelia]CAK70779.1 unnamed protein product [Paramecium tetraurelia]|eukprot:XP_001438176.1 hypothetical protein (macronuclear) [Paramecium tetraurelia strain d4-2]
MSKGYQASVTSLGQITQQQQANNPMCETKLVSSVLQVPKILEHCNEFNTHNIPRINCYNHQGYNYTNFCQLEGCCFPLCPECIPQHVQEHFESQSKPKLDSLENVLNKIQLTVHNEANKLASCFQNITNSVLMADQMNMQCIKLLNEKKERIIKIIEQHFNSLLIDVQGKHIKNIENYKRDAQFFKQVIQDRWNSHVELLDNLKNQDCMRPLIRFLKSKTLQENEQYFLQAQEFTERYALHQTKVSFDSEKSSQLGGFISEFLKVVNYDLPEYLNIHKLAPPEITTSKSNAGSAINSKASIRQSEQKISQSQTKGGLEISQQAQYMNQSPGSNNYLQQSQQQFGSQRQMRNNYGEYPSLSNFGSRKQ